MTAILLRIVLALWRWARTPPTVADVLAAAHPGTALSPPPEPCSGDFPAPSLDPTDEHGPPPELEPTPTLEETALAMGLQPQPLIPPPLTLEVLHYCPMRCPVCYRPVMVMDLPGYGVCAAGHIWRAEELGRRVRETRHCGRN